MNVRGIGGVVIGYLVFGISAGFLFRATGQDPHASATIAFIVFSTLYGIVFAFLGGFAATTISGIPSLIPALVVGVLIAAGAIVSMLARPGDGEIWSQLGALLLMAPSAAAGGAARLWMLFRSTPDRR
jgi:peptidoglycan/LPS O-acetylase OafA/YrhL